MFGILSRRWRQSSTPRPVNRARLQCEQLNERVNPTTGSFTGDIWGVSGQFTYDETLVDFTDPEQVIPFIDLWFNSSFGMFTADENPVEANFEYGQFVGMEFDATPSNPDVPHLSINIDGYSGIAVAHSSPSHTFNFTVNVVVPPNVELEYQMALATCCSA